MALLWTPASALPLAEQLESAALGIGVDVVSDVPSDVIDALDWSIDKPLPQLDVMASITGGGTGASFTISALDLLGLHAPLGVKYRVGATLAEAATFDAVPPGPEVEIYEYRPDPNNQVTAHLTLRLHLNGAWVSEVFSLVVEANYDTGRDRLLAELAAREPA